MRVISTAIVAALTLCALPAAARDLKIALIESKTGPLEAYAKQSEQGFMLGLEYLTQGSMNVAGRKIVVSVKDDQTRPDLAKSLLEQAYNDEGVDLAAGYTFSASALAALDVAKESKKILMIEPAVADEITGIKGNRYIFRSSRSGMQDILSALAALPDEPASIGVLTQDYAFGRDGVAAMKSALAFTHSKAQLVAEEYAPVRTTDFTAPAERLFTALKTAPGHKWLVVLWAGPSPFAKIMDLHPERFGIDVAPGGNILPVMQGYKDYPGTMGAITYYWGFPKNPQNDWLVAECRKRFGTPPDMFTASGFALASAIVTALTETKGVSDTETLIKTMEGMRFATPKGEMQFRKEDHQALQEMYVWRVKAKPSATDPYDLLDLVRVVGPNDIQLPITQPK
jgi:branched-chain amino acid transport system substrate-binding protein